jgi:nitroreductase
LAQEALEAAVTLPPGFEATCFVAVGHPAESPEPPRRKALEQIIQFVQAEHQTHQERA